jgi:hypothetical protein
MGKRKVPEDTLVVNDRTGDRGTGHGSWVMGPALRRHTIWKNLEKILVTQGTLMHPAKIKQQPPRYPFLPDP